MCCYWIETIFGKQMRLLYPPAVFMFLYSTKIINILKNIDSQSVFSKRYAQ